MTNVSNVSLFIAYIFHKYNEIIRSVKRKRIGMQSQIVTASS